MCEDTGAQVATGYMDTSLLWAALLSASWIPFSNRSIVENCFSEIHF